MESETLDQSLNLTASCIYSDRRSISGVADVEQHVDSSLESECLTTKDDLALKKKSQETGPHLDGRCIYLVGMMGSGKTTIGQILSQLLHGYSFFDSDKLVEEAAGGATVADIFKLHGESFFREMETEVLRKLSRMYRLVISTGGGAVVEPINWKYMHKGIIVFIDVPLEVLARRITSVGTTSRPLLDHGYSDSYVKTLRQLSMLGKERSEAYNNAHVRVSLENMAAKLGQEDACHITPTQIAIEALVQCKSYLKKECNNVHLL
ncbi:putative shikimate kinase [Helianthus debilis subsp. tardiflorus]